MKNLGSPHLSRVMSLVTLLGVSLQAQPVPVPGPDINVISCTKPKPGSAAQLAGLPCLPWPFSDPFLQRQNEPSGAVSSENQLVLVAGGNDYRGTDLSFQNPAGFEETGDVRLGLYKSFDGGLTWSNTLLPGYSLDDSPEGLAAPQKRFAASADPTVRAGPAGMFYYSGIAFDRGDRALGIIFAARFNHLNNKENHDPSSPGSDSVQYLGAVEVDNGTAGQFTDKSWLGVGLPFGTGTCSIPGRSTPVPAHRVHLAYTVFTGGNRPSSQIKMATSTDCGATFARPIKISESNSRNQGTVVALNPVTGKIYVAWLRKATSSEPEAILISWSVDFGKTFSKAVELATFGPNVLLDQTPGGASFRMSTFPALAVDENDRVYVAWSQRGLPGLPAADSRIVVATSQGGATWDAANRVIAHLGAPGERMNQFFPTLTYVGGVLTLGYYANLHDHKRGVYKPSPDGGYSETFEAIPGGAADVVFKDTVDAFPISDAGMSIRHIIDAWVAQALPAVLPGFTARRVSQYAFGDDPRTPEPKLVQLQFNPPSLPMFNKGSRGFIGDYIDLAGQTFVFENGAWRFNYKSTDQNVTHLFWADNRNVRTPAINANGKPDWTLYTPPTVPNGMFPPGTLSIIDPSQNRPACTAGTTGTRNQDIRTSRITPGLLLGAQTNSKQLNTASGGRQIQHAFSVFIHNATRSIKYFRATIQDQPPPFGPQFGRASWRQFPLGEVALGGFYSSAAPAGLPPVGQTQIDVKVYPRSKVAQPVFVTSNGNKAKIGVSVVEVTAPGAGGAPGTPVPGGLVASTTLNPDQANPDQLNPDQLNPDQATANVSTAEIFNPDQANPDQANPALSPFANPDQANPDQYNPDQANPDQANPDQLNPDLYNPDQAFSDLTNPDQANPDQYNPDQANPDQANPDQATPLVDTKTIRDVTFRLTNNGNTRASFLTRVLLRSALNQCLSGCGKTGQPLCQQGCRMLQLTIHRRVQSAVTASGGCTYQVQTQNILLANVTNPQLIANPDQANPDQANPDQATPAVDVGPGETVEVTVRYASPIVSATCNNCGNVQLSPDESIAPSFGLSVAPVEQSTDPGFAFQSVVQSSGVGTTDAFAGVTRPPVSLTITSTNLNNPPPPGVVGVSYSYSLAAIGGNLPYTWGLAAGSLPLPSGLSGPNPATGGLSGTPTLKGSFAPTFQVTDSAPAGGTVFETATQTLTIQVSEIKITGMMSASPALVKGGQPVTVQATVLNDGPATINSISLNSLAPATVSGTATAGCLAATPASATMAGNATQVFTFTCTPSGDGTLKFVLTNGIRVGGVATGTGNGESNTITVVSSGPTMTVSATSNGSSYTSGTWTRFDVLVTFVCSAAVSGVNVTITGGAAAGPAPGPLSALAPPVTTEGAGQSVNATCTDAVGNTANGSITDIRIDKTAPVITFVSRLPAANANGWNNTNVTVTWSCSDAVSGPVSPSVNQTLTTEGSNQSAIGTCTDLAGNTASNTQTGINIDKTAPVITLLSRTPPPNAAGWNNTNVTVTWSCTDALSGPVAASLSQTLTAEGANQSATGTCTDLAGSSSSNTQTVSIDKTAPTVGITAPASYFPAKTTTYVINSAVASNYSCSDGLSGVSSLAAPVPSGSNFNTSAPGLNNFTVTCSDAAGNASVVTNQYLNVFTFTGGRFVDEGTAGEKTAGAAAPLDFTLGTATGLETNLAVIVMINVVRNAAQPPTGDCPAAPDAELVNGSGELIGTQLWSGGGATGGSSLRNDGVEFKFNWDTTVRPSPTGLGCHTVSLLTSDNTGSPVVDPARVRKTSVRLK